MNEPPTVQCEHGKPVSMAEQVHGECQECDWCRRCNRVTRWKGEVCTVCGAVWGDEG